MLRSLSYPGRRCRLWLEQLEERTVPATIYARTLTDTLVTIDSGNPGALIASRPITGLQSQETIRAVDFNPQTGDLFGLGIVDTPGPDTGRLYKINAGTGVASPVAAGAVAFSASLA